MNRKSLFTLSDFIQENLEKVNPKMLKEIETTLEKASNFEKLHHIHEIASPLYENFSVKTGIKESSYHRKILSIYKKFSNPFVKMKVII